MKKFVWLGLSILGLALAACSSESAGTAPEKPSDTSSVEKVSFAASVQPILTKNCISCHSGDRPKEGLNLESLEWLNKGAHGNPVYEAGKSGESLLYKVLTGEGAKLMPPDGKLSDADIAVVKNWIDSGAAE